jgi:quercetin dioxygenase-like cupin family protein
MRITRNTLQTVPDPSEWFTGAVYINTVATPSEPSHLAAGSVHFTLGAQAAWHTHPNDQTMYVTEGVALCQGHGREIEIIRPGDHVFFDHGEDHRHGAVPNCFMTHIAM